ncbi:hypothetical protein [Pseudoclavibacter sp. VKM Ac-2888]|uniref:hypothetical protein n=1 Tax=Pseudoclavibacter sp. VKM Ac-2888 TaxID=2783830 RepID=UPI00188B16C2|nr:hypothetical protein [Pseudoclavibacter sp. VKM Ac-2888]MBF4549246.1 hypothetical protein [Pseudoclavibacter sp. VKM Ac-2888]
MNDLVIPFPTLGHLLDSWLFQHVSIPDGWQRGEPFGQTRWQYWCTANHYRIREGAQSVDGRPLGAQAFVYRKSLIIGPQKSGKGPWSAGLTSAEAVGPTQFIGWAKKGDAYRCADWGCPCGWEYAYEVGEPMGGRHPSPLIHLTALTVDQVDNVYGPLTEMIAAEPLSRLLLVRDDFVRIQGSSLGGKRDRIDAVTSKASSKLGQPIHFALQDEFGLWLESNGMQNVADTQDRNATGMNGRTLATTNAPDPSENSAAQKLIEEASEDVFIYWDEPPRDLDFSIPEDRIEIFRYVYRDSPWVSVDGIEALSAALAKRDPGQAERFFGNRMVRGKGKFFPDMQPWDGKRSPVEVRPRTKVALGFDGSDANDWTGIRLETLGQHQFTPTYTAGDVTRLALWKPEEWGGRIPREEVRAAVEHIFRTYDVTRGYFDPYLWQTDIAAWAQKYGEKRVIEWPTNGIKRMHAELVRFRDDVLEVDSAFTHDGCSEMRTNVSNAVVRARAGETFIIGKPEDHQKIDLLMSGVLAHAAACDSIAAGLGKAQSSKVSTVAFGFN